MASSWEMAVTTPCMYLRLFSDMIGSSEHLVMLQRMTLGEYIVLTGIHPSPFNIFWLKKKERKKRGNQLIKK